MSSLPDDLRAAYETTHYAADLPGGRVVLSTQGVLAGDSDLVQDRSLVVVTAWNPGTERPGTAANQAANERLQRVLSARGWRVYPAEGYSPDRSHIEPSFAVVDAPEAEVTAVARHFGQAAVFHWDGAHGRVLYLGSSA